MWYSRVFVLIIGLCGSAWSFSQVANTSEMDTAFGIHINKLVIGIYLDTYYGYDFDEPANSDVPYVVCSSRHNEANVNLAMLEFQYHSERMRAVIAPGFGTYVQANNSSEPIGLRNLIEAHAGFKLFRKKEVWLDFGVLGSPYSSESPFSKDQLMYTRSLATEFVPYYLTGAKLSFPLGSKLNAHLYVLNGWQQMMDLNSAKSIGTQLEWRPGEKSLFNWNTYIGDERSAVRPFDRMRYFTDFYWIFNPEGKFSVTSCAYVGIQETVDPLSPKKFLPWYTANFIGRASFTKNVSLSARFEFFDDPYDVMVTPINPVGEFLDYSAGLCLNIKLFDHALWRFEGRHFFSESDLYTDKNGNPFNQMPWVVSSVTMWF
jgi:hypothetical protein